ncbi:MAG: PD-(D/E)XK nuclease family protein [Pseudomonadota bacterium]
MPDAPISKAELFERLAGGRAAGITVVTPNLRLAQVLKSEFDSYQSDRNVPVWEDAQILHFAVFLNTLYEEAVYSGDVTQLPRLLTPEQEHALWEGILADSGLLAVPQAAADCRKAWNLAHEWRIAGALGSFPGNEDAKAFVRWSREYERRCRREDCVDSAVLPDLLLKLKIRKPRLLVAYAFDVLPPQAREFLEGFEVVSCRPEARRSVAGKTSFPSPREELEAAAQWARTKLEAGTRRIGVVVPELKSRRKEVVRVFSRVLRPGFNQPGNERGALPFNVSLGAPLAEFPIVAFALSLLELSLGEIQFEAASRLIRSPFLAGADEELSARALLDAALRKKSPARLSLGKLVGLVHGCPLLRRRLEALYAVPRPESASPQRWGRCFTQLLEAAGFPGRSLDSDEYQARMRFEKVLAEFARLEGLLETISFRKAVEKLSYLCRETLFQPESPDTPIQVLGALESAGQEFDALWVSGLTDEAWPLHVPPNPFIPPALQRKAGIPEASPEAALAKARAITAGWLGAAPEVVVSYPERDGDRSLIPSPLIVALPASEIRFPRHKNFKEIIFEKRRIQKIPDGRAPALATKTPKGGTKILLDQSACPFRAFATHRLGARPLEEPVEGLDAMARGSLLHELMKALWTELKGSEGLRGDCGPAIERAAAAAVREMKLDEPLASLEKRRLAKLAREWLEVEKERSAFKVFVLEHKIPLKVAGLELDGRIDRMDQLASGGHAVIDYKTSRPKVAHWQGERPEDPQLPLYALSAPGEVAAVAFAQLRTGEMRFVGCARSGEDIPGAKEIKNWPGMIAGWRKVLEALGAGFAAGEARVDPKKLIHTCRYCKLQPLCRVYERINVLEEEGGEQE